MDLGEVRAIGEIADLDQVLSAYRAGLFPMGLGEDGAPPTAWWSPRVRGVLLPGRLRISRSLRRSLRRTEITVDRSFAEVVARCADPSREGAWISSEMEALYAALHAAGWAHSVEARRDGELVGGVFGIGFGEVFCGESMFTAQTDGSKCALVGLADRLEAAMPGRWMLDAQWPTDHLSSLGVSRLAARDYRERLAVAELGGHSPAFHKKSSG